jgi:hypothetical protein
MIIIIIIIKIIIKIKKGLLARAEKRLQVNYLLTSKTFPTAKPTSEEFSNQVCANITSLLNQLLDSRIPNIPPFLYNLSQSCNLTYLEPLLICLSKKTDWNLNNNHIYFPYGWAEEGFYFLCINIFLYYFYYYYY